MFPNHIIIRHLYCTLSQRIRKIYIYPVEYWPFFTPAAKVQPSLEGDIFVFLRATLWNKLITGNCADDFCTYLKFLEEFRENNGPRWNFARRLQLKTSASSCKVVIPSYSKVSFYRVLQLEWQKIQCKRTGLQSIHVLN